MEYLKDLQPILDSLFSKFTTVGPAASAVILVVFVIGFLVLLGYIANLKMKSPDWSELPRSALNQIGAEEQGFDRRSKKIIDGLRDEVEKCHQKIDELRSNPFHSSIERLYFGVNGIVNSGFILSVALLVWELVSLHGGSPNEIIKLSAVRTELGYLMIALVATLLISSIVVYVSRLKDGGRAYERINRAFIISFVIAVASLGVFIFVHQSA